MGGRSRPAGAGSRGRGARARHGGAGRCSRACAAAGTRPTRQGDAAPRDRAPPGSGRPGEGCLTACLGERAVHAVGLCPASGAAHRPPPPRPPPTVRAPTQADPPERECGVMRASGRRQPNQPMMEAGKHAGRAAPSPRRPPIKTGAPPPSRCGARAVWRRLGESGCFCPAARRQQAPAGSQRAGEDRQPPGAHDARAAAPAARAGRRRQQQQEADHTAAARPLGNPPEAASRRDRALAAPARSPRPGSTSCCPSSPPRACPLRACARGARASVEARRTLPGTARHP